MKIKFTKNLPDVDDLTPNKEYVATYWQGNLYTIEDDVGDELIVTVGEHCFHLGCDGWEIVEED